MLNNGISFYCQKAKGGTFWKLSKILQDFLIVSVILYVKTCGGGIYEKKSFDEIIDYILILIVIIGFATFGIGCVIDSIFIWIAIFTGKIMISANTYILLMGVPAVGTPAIFLLSLLIIRVMKFFVK